MNKKIILSIALLSSITQYSYTKMPIRSIMFLSTVASSVRFGWLAGKSTKETPQEIAKDAAITMITDIKETAKAVKTNGQDAYNWVEDTIKGIGSNDSNTSPLTPPTIDPSNDETNKLTTDENIDPVEGSNQ